MTIVCDVEDHSDASDIKDRPRKMAHVNLNAIDVDRTNASLIENLGFKLIDQSGPPSFLHCDNSDHSSIFVCGTAKPTINHIAFELPDLEAVMRAAGRMCDAEYPIEWGRGRQRCRRQRIRVFRGPRGNSARIHADVLQVDDSYVPHGREYWKWPPGRMDQWGITPPHTQRWSASRICSASEARGYRHQASAASRIRERRMKCSEDQQQSAGRS